MSDQTDKLRDSLGSLKREIGYEAKRYDKEAKTRRRFDVSIRAISAILAVAAPALVTYTPSGDTVAGIAVDSFKVLVIFLVGFAGASITLQAVFAFDRKYANSKMTAIRLMEIERKVEFDLQLSALSSDDHESYRILRNRFEAVASSRSDAIKKYVEEDINTVLSTDARVEAATEKTVSNEGALGDSPPRSGEQ